MKKCGKISSIFEFSISKLGYMEIQRNQRKTFLTYLLNNISLIKGKTKMKMKQIGKMNSIF